MSYRAIYDVALHLGKFRNLDLVFEGIYCLKFKLFYELELPSGRLTIYGNPYVVKRKKSALEKKIE